MADTKSITTDMAAPVEPNKEEQQYLDLVQHIIDHGAVRGDRTGTGTASGKFSAFTTG
jgi:hypothetical protein